MSINLMLGDCLERMKEIPDGSVDMILCDPPYGTTSCKWDSVIDLERMWEQLERVIKPNGAILLFGAEPFSSYLRVSNIKKYKYDWVWYKDNCTGFMQAKTKPLNCYESISVFGSFRIAAQYFDGTYNPQGIKSVGKIEYSNSRKDDHITGNRVKGVADANTGYPRQVLNFSKDSGKSLHPTQKPIPLMEYLVKTYTNEQETVLDFTMGSGTTGVACKNLSRNFIGIEKDEKYFEIAKNRIERIK